MLTWLEINRSALRHNLQEFRRIVGPKTKIMAVIKSNAYGHGFLEIAKFYDTNKDVDLLAVANLDEALALRQNKIKKSIFILTFFEPQKLKTVPAKFWKDMAIPIYDLKTAQLANQLAQKQGIKIKIHLKVDTGTSRIGFLPNELLTKKTLKMLKTLKNIKIGGLFSHLAASEENLNYTKKQLKTFSQIISRLKEQGIDPPLKHISCTAASLVVPKSHFNIARIGLGLYGLWPSPQTKNRNGVDLKPALSWHTRLIQVKKIPKNTPVGYGCTYITKRSTLLGIIPVGYWDGFDRKLSNGGQVLFKGQKRPILGRICMNLTMVDLTGLSAKVGDKVTLLGRQGKNTITAENLANKIGTINYEVVTRINPLIPRIVN